MRFENGAGRGVCDPSAGAVPSALLLSVIIPALNEAGELPGLLGALMAQRDVSLEIIVSDGGSSDATPDIARESGALVVEAPRGRGTQMNAGARLARGEYLLFLHADSRLDGSTLLSQALSTLHRVISERGHHRIAGHFALNFDRSGRDNALAYRYAEEKTTLNRPYTTNGDQGYLLSRRFFQELGGFDESLPFLEDQRLAEAIRARGQWITLPGILHTSARRFETEGFHRRYLLMAIIMAMHYGDVHEFFTRAPQVYRAQHETERLRMAPFLRLIWRIMAERGWRRSLNGWLRVGGFVRENAWQAFFFLDVLAGPLLGKRRHPALSAYDRLISPLLRYRLFDPVAAALVFVWTMGILHPVFWLLERPGQTSPR